jgi:hypothetical protein
MINLRTQLVIKYKYFTEDKIENFTKKINKYKSVDLAVSKFKIYDSGICVDLIFSSTKEIKDLNSIVKQLLTYIVEDFGSIKNILELVLLTNTYSKDEIRETLFSVKKLKK